MQSQSDSPEYRREKPLIAGITRRQLITLAGGVLACGSTAVVVSRLSSENEQARPQAGTERVNLPSKPSHNPAFQGWPGPDGSVVLATYKGQDEFVGYQVNRTGRLVWELCSGDRSEEEIARSYAEKTGRSELEAREFLRALTELSLVAQGGHVVAAGPFPKAAPGECYYVRIGHGTSPL